MSCVRIVSTGVIFLAMASFHHATLAERPMNRSSYMAARAAHQVATADRPDIRLRLEVLEVSLSKVEETGMGMIVAVDGQQSLVPDIVGRFSQEVINGNDESNAAESLRDALEALKRAGWGKWLFDQSMVVPLGQGVATRIPQVPGSSTGFVMVDRSKAEQPSATDGVSMDVDQGSDTTAVELSADRVDRGRIHVQLKVRDHHPTATPQAGAVLSTSTTLGTQTRNAHRLVPDGGILAMSGRSRIKHHSEARRERPLKLGPINLPFGSRVKIASFENRIETIFIVTAHLVKASESSAQ